MKPTRSPHRDDTAQLTRAIAADAANGELIAKACGHPGVAGDRILGTGPAPIRQRNDPGLHHLEPVEEPLEVGPGPQGQLRRAHPLVEPRGPLGHPPGVDVADGVGDGQVAARRERLEHVADDPPGVVPVRDVLQDHQRHDRDRPAQVEGLRRARQHLLGVPDVGRNVGDGPLGRAGQQCPGVSEHDRVVVDVHDPGVWGDLLGDLVGVLRGRQTGAQVKKLPDPGLRGQVAHRASEEGPVGSHAMQDGRVGRDHLLPGLPVGGEVILPAEPVVVHPGGMGPARVERDSFGGRVAGLSHEPPSLSAAASAARNRNRFPP